MVMNFIRGWFLLSTLCVSAEWISVPHSLVNVSVTCDIKLTYSENRRDNCIGQRVMLVRTALADTW